MSYREETYNEAVYNFPEAFVNIVIWEGCYANGYRPARYPLPAPILFVEQHQYHYNCPFHDSIIIVTINYDSDGTPREELACIWDFCFDRACDFFLPYGQYANARQIQEGTDAYAELQSLNQRRQ